MLEKCNDPYINDTPYEIFRDDKGRVIAEYYRHIEPAHDREPKKGEEAKT